MSTQCGTQMIPKNETMRISTPWVKLRIWDRDLCRRWKEDFHQELVVEGTVIKDWEGLCYADRCSKACASFSIIIARTYITTNHVSTSESIEFTCWSYLLSDWIWISRNLASHNNCCSSLFSAISVDFWVPRSTWTNKVTYMNFNSHLGAETSLRSKWSGYLEECIFEPNLKSSKRTIIERIGWFCYKPPLRDQNNLYLRINFIY